MEKNRIITLPRKPVRQPTQQPHIKGIQFLQAHPEVSGTNLVHRFPIKTTALISLCNYATTVWANWRKLEKIPRKPVRQPTQQPHIKGIQFYKHILKLVALSWHRYQIS